MSTHCNFCKGEVLLGEGGVVAIDHAVTCVQLLEVDWAERPGEMPEVPGVNPDIVQG